MTDDTEVVLSEDEQALEVIENTLDDIHGDKSYDDIDADEYTTEETTNDEEKETDEEKIQQDSTDEDDSEDSGEETSAEGEAGAEGETVPEEPAANDNLDDGIEEVDDDKLASSMTEKTRERFDHFRYENKRITQEFEEQAESFNQLRESTEVMNHYINDSQISPEQLSAALSIAKAINTGDMSLAREAFPRMQSMMNHVAIGLGDSSAQVEMRPELKAQQDNLDITPELANRQALNDAQNQQRQQYEQQHQRELYYQEQHQQQEHQRQQVLHRSAQQAAEDIKQWENGMVSGDPDFNVKRTQMLQSSSQIMENNPPEQWLELIQNQYGTITQTMNNMAAQQTRSSARNQGIRPTAITGSGHDAPEPKNLDELIKRDLARMRGQAG